MTRAAYLIGSVQIILIVSALGYGAIRTRKAILPAWSGAPAALVDVVLGLTGLILLAEALGTLGLLTRVPLLLGAIATAVGARAFAERHSRERRGSSEPVPQSDGLADRTRLLIGAGVGLVVIAKWMLATRVFLDEGMWGFDSMWYHLPLAAGFAQSGSTLGPHYLDPVALTNFAPASSELLHTVGIVILDRDILSPLLNLGWLAVALLAAWCLGRPFGTSPASLAAAGIVLLAPGLLARQPGNAYSDTAAVALLLSSAAILLNAAPRSPRNAKELWPTLGLALVPAALAAGLAMGTKTTLIAPVAAMTAGLFLIEPGGRRRAVGRYWLIPLVIAGSYWYLRNLLVTGSPLPYVTLGVGPLAFPAPQPEVQLTPDYSLSIGHYLTDRAVLKGLVFPGFDLAWGKPWFLLVGLSFAGAVGTLVDRATPVQKVIGASVLLGLVAYVLTPTTAAGPDGHPSVVAQNARWAAPVLAVGLALLPTLPAFRSPDRQLAVLAVLLVVLTTKIEIGKTLDDPHIAPTLVITASLIAFALLAARLAPRARPAELVVGIALTAVLATALYWRPAGNYLDHRYSSVWTRLHVASSIAWAEGLGQTRIGLGGTTAAFLQYGYYGKDLSNHVRYVAEHGPHGALNPIQTCSAWREAVNKGRFDYLVTTPTLNPSALDRPGFSPEDAWTRGDPAARAVQQDGPVTVYELNGPLDPAACSALRPPPFTGIAPLLPRR